MQVITTTQKDDDGHYTGLLSRATPGEGGIREPSKQLSVPETIMLGKSKGNIFIFKIMYIKSWSNIPTCLPNFVQSLGIRWNQMQFSFW